MFHSPLNIHLNATLKEKPPNQAKTWPNYCPHGETRPDIQKNISEPSCEINKLHWNEYNILLSPHPKQLMYKF
jgi:hypothetical protein